MTRFITAIAVAVALSAAANMASASDADLAQIREQIRQMKDEYETRIRALERRLQEAESKDGRGVAAQGGVQPIAAAVASVPQRPFAGGGNTFSPAISLTLGGSYAHLSQDPSQYRIRGFMPGGEGAGPGSRNFNLGESELTMSASIDPRFFGQLTFALGKDNEASVEEAFFRTQGLAGGVNVTAGRFLSGIGYINSRHAHTWDFVDLPLAYQAFLGGQYRHDGVRATWLAPLDRFVELGIEGGRGDTFPGSERNTNRLNATSAFVRLGDDWGVSASWRVGLSYLRTRPVDRRYDDEDSAGNAVVNAFTGKSSMWIADGVVKWAPQGNASITNFKLQGEYFRRKERGTLGYDVGSATTGPIAGRYDSAQSGFYVQGVYQFMPQWRAGLRYDELNAGTSRYAAIDDGTLATSDLSKLLSYNPSRTTAMVDYSPSEFSRLRFQIAREQSRPGATNTQVFIQYIMSLGAHAAHAF